MSPTAPVPVSPCSTEAEKFLALEAFGRPSGVWVDKNDMLYVADFAIGRENNPGCKNGYPRRQREGPQGHGLYSPPAGVNEKTPPPEGSPSIRTAPSYAARRANERREKYTNSR